MPKLTIDEIEAIVTASYKDGYRDMDVIEAPIVGRLPDVNFGYVDPFEGENLSEAAGSLTGSAFRTIVAPKPESEGVLRCWLA